jgi:acyl carrier protein
MKVFMGLDTVEFVLWSENEFEIEIPDEDAQNILTVGQFTTYIHHKLLDIHGSNATSEAEIFKRIKKFLVSEFKIAAEKINHSSNFVNDFGLDQ